MHIGIGTSFRILFCIFYNKKFRNLFLITFLVTSIKISNKYAGNLHYYFIIVKVGVNLNNMYPLTVNFWM